MTGILLEELQILDYKFLAAGATAFDSRSLLTNSTAQIKAVWGPGTRSGNNASLTTDSDFYCDSYGFSIIQQVKETVYRSSLEC